jgi:ornithine cyclodeaminase/alanine dehydrogenase-like protein (mu-crystallin family)
MTLLVLNRQDVETLLDIRSAIDLVNNAMKAVSRGETRQLLRRLLPLPGTAGVLGDMPGSLAAGGTFGLKCVAALPATTPGHPSHQGAVLLFEPGSGEPVALIEAGILTAIRTAAATASATRHLARSNARVLGLLGAGEQAHWHVPALIAVRPFERVLVWARNPERAANFARAMSALHRVACSSVRDAADAAAADVVCTLTSAPEPVLRGEWLRDGAHVNLVGSSSSGPCEADEYCVARSRYFVDWEESARAQASEFRRALDAKVITDAHLLGEIGAVALGRIAGRRTESEITLYKSLGVIAQDLVCGWHVYERALAEGVGQQVKLTE